MTINERIKKRRKELHMSADDVANIINKDRTTVYRYESSYIENMPVGIIKPLAKALNCSVGYLMGLEDEPNGEPDKTDDSQTIRNVLPVTVKTIPLFKEISCGQPVFAEQDIESYVPVGSEIEADFCVIANGDSMTGARINDGDIVFIRQTERVNDGEIAAVWIDGEGATFHGLRHTAASYMIKNNVPITTVSGVLGHSNTTTTLNIYSHMIESTKKGAIDILTGVFTPAENEDEKTSVQ